MLYRSSQQAAPPRFVKEIDAILATASLLSPPKVALRLLELCGSSTAGAAEIAHVIENDPAMAARLIRLANTVHYGAGIPVTNIQAATVRLGVDKIKSVALAFEVACLTNSVASDRFDFEAHWQGSVARGCVARAIAMNCQRGIAGEAFLVGLLQDLGIPVLAQHTPDAYRGLLEQADGCQLRLATLESQLSDFNHIHVVAQLFYRWGMPALLADAIGRHHTRPPTQNTTDPALRLWQIAYFVGLLPIGRRREPTFYDTSLCGVLAATFGITGSEEVQLLHQAELEFNDIEEMFRPYIGHDVSAADLMAQAADLLGVVGPATADGPEPQRSGGPSPRELEPPSRNREIAAATVTSGIEKPSSF